MTSNDEIQMPNECQEPNASEIGWQHHVVVQLSIHMVIMLFGLHLASDSLDFVILVQRLLPYYSSCRKYVPINTGGEAAKGFGERGHTAISSRTTRKAVKGIVGRSEARPLAASGTLYGWPKPLS